MDPLTATLAGVVVTGVAAWLLFGQNHRADRVKLDKLDEEVRELRKWRHDLDKNLNDIVRDKVDGFCDDYDRRISALEGKGRR